jgi:hypothetical protein
MHSNYNSTTKEAAENTQIIGGWITLFNDQWVVEDIREEINEVNENEITIFQNIWVTAKAFLRGKFIAISAYVKRTERSQINCLMLHLKLLEKQE